MTGLGRPGLTLTVVAETLREVVQELFPGAPFTVRVTGTLELLLEGQTYIEWQQVNRHIVAGDPVYSTRFYNWVVHRIVLELAARVKARPWSEGHYYTPNWPGYATFEEYMARFTQEIQMAAPSFRWGTREAEYEGCPVSLLPWFRS